MYKHIILLVISLLFFGLDFLLGTYIGTIILFVICAYGLVYFGTLELKSFYRREPNDLAVAGLYGVPLTIYVNVLWYGLYIILGKFYEQPDAWVIALYVGFGILWLLLMLFYIIIVVHAVIMLFREKLSIPHIVCIIIMLLPFLAVFFYIVQIMVALF